MLGSLGFPELLFIFFVALLIFGPRKLPEIGRTIGKGLAEFRKASTDLKRSLNAEMIEEELRQSDPRKLLQDEPVTGPAKTPDKAPESSSDVEPVEHPAAAGTVSRGSIDDGASGEDSSTDPSSTEKTAESLAQ